MSNKYDVLIVGGGAAGFFAANQLNQNFPGIKICMLEKNSKILQKVKVSGGGRCNVTHNCYEPVKLSTYYPRGSQFLKKLFYQFSPEHTIKWFAAKGLQLYCQDDGRYFPVSNNSQSVIDCLSQIINVPNFKLVLNQELTEIKSKNNEHTLTSQTGDTWVAKKLIITCGGYHKIESYKWLSNSGISIIEPIPSLFTFNINEHQLKELSGISLNSVTVSLPGTKFSFTGPLLITHWGVSGPAVIGLSSLAAAYLFEKKYSHPVKINWLPELNSENCLNEWKLLKSNNPNYKLYKIGETLGIPSRLFNWMVNKSGIREKDTLQEVSFSDLNRLKECIFNCILPMNAKTTFKEEFVTCGGVDLKKVNPETLESKEVKGIYFAGEILNIDGLTGGFNFQAAWTTAWVASKLIG